MEMETEAIQLRSFWLRGAVGGTNQLHALEGIMLNRIKAACLFTVNVASTAARVIDRVNPLHKLAMIVQEEWAVESGKAEGRFVWIEARWRRGIHPINCPSGLRLARKIMMDGSVVGRPEINRLEDVDFSEGAAWLCHGHVPNKMRPFEDAKRSINEKGEEIWEIQYQGGTECLPPLPQLDPLDDEDYW